MKRVALPKGWGWRQPRPEDPTLAGLRKLVARERRRRLRQEREWSHDALMAEAEFDAWRATRDW